MSTTEVQYYVYLSQQIAVYLGIPILIVGAIGNVLNLIVFLSLKTFRENACAFYLTVMTVASLGQLASGLLSRIMVSGFNVDWMSSSVFYCKFRAYLFQFFALTSFECMGLATVNQFLATCATPYLHGLSNTKLAHRIVVAVTFAWLLHGIPYLIYYDYVRSPTTGVVSCGSSSDALNQYHMNGVTLVFSGVLPICINCVFGLLAYHNINRLDRRAMPVAQRELDKQLTSIIFIQFIYHTTATVPYLIVVVLSQTSITAGDAVAGAKLDLATVVTICIYYLNYAVSASRGPPSCTTSLSLCRFPSTCTCASRIDSVGSSSTRSSRST